jgi:hypothetical protein
LIQKSDICHVIDPVPMFRVTFAAALAPGAEVTTATKEIIGAIKDQINICTKPLRRAL